MKLRLCVGYICLLLICTSQSFAGVWRVFDSPEHRFAFAVKREVLDPDLGGTWSDPDKPKLERDTLKKVVKWLDEAYRMEIIELGFREPFGERFRDRIVVKVEDFGSDRTTLGYMRSADGQLFLNARVLADPVRGVGDNFWNKDKPIMQVTVAHELFHAVQFAYNEFEDPWLYEATAQWVEDEVFPENNDVVSWEAVFLEKPELSLHLYKTGPDPDSPGSTRVETELGRPYGGSIFFRFLSKHHPRGEFVVRDIWEESENISGANTSIRAILKAIAGDRVTSQDERVKIFRDYYERFVVGSFLMNQAPENSRLKDVDLFRNAQRDPNDPLPDGVLDRTALRAEMVGLGSAWEKFIDEGGTRPADAILTLSFDQQVAPNRKKDGSIMGMATRYFQIPYRDAMTSDSVVQVAVKGKKKELSVQGMAPVGETWTVFPAAYNEDKECWQLRFPKYWDLTSHVYVAVTRYAASSKMDEAKVYPLSITYLEPPILGSLRLSQGSKYVAERQWSPDFDSEGSVISRSLTSKDEKIDATGADLTLSLVFSRPVRQQGSTAMVKVNGHDVTMQASQDNYVWSGTFQASLLHPDKESSIVVNAQTEGSWNLPLDEDPETIPKLACGEWINYKSTGKGLEIVVGKPRPFSPNLSIDWSEARYPEGQTGGLVVGKLHFDPNQDVVPIDPKIYESFYSKPEHSSKGYYTWLLRYDYDGRTTYDTLFFDSNSKRYVGGKYIYDQRIDFPVRSPSPHPVALTLYTGHPEHAVFQIIDIVPISKLRVQGGISDKTVENTQAKIAEFAAEDAKRLARWQESGKDADLEEWIGGYVDYVKLHTKLYGTDYFKENGQQVLDEVNRRVGRFNGDWLRFKDIDILTKTFYLINDAYYWQMRYDELAAFFEGLAPYYSRKMTISQQYGFTHAALLLQQLADLYAKELLDAERAQELLNLYQRTKDPVEGRVRGTQEAIEWAKKVRAFFPDEAFK